MLFSIRALRQVARSATALLTLAVVVAWFVLFRPPALGGTASFVAVNGISMTGTFSNGTLALVEKKSSYHVGDIVAYRIPAGETGAGQNIIHRIVGGNGTTGFVTKGDHNSYTDTFWHPKTADVIGRVWFVIPGGANLLGKLREPAVLAGVVALVSFALFAWPSGLKEAADSGPGTPGGTSEADSGDTLDPDPVSEAGDAKGRDRAPVLVGAGARESQVVAAEVTGRVRPSIAGFGLLAVLTGLISFGRRHERPRTPRRP